MDSDNKPAMAERSASDHRRAAWLRIAMLTIGMLASGCGGGGGGGGAPAYAVGGAVTGLVGTLVLQDNGTDDLSLNASGAFHFATPLDTGTAYLVSVHTQPGNQTCVVGNTSGTIGTADVSNVSVRCTTNRRSIGGSVTGLLGAGLVLQDNGTDDLVIASDGSFTFATPVAAGAPYAVTLKTSPGAPSQTCTIGNGNGTVAGTPVVNVVVSCVTAASGAPDTSFGSAGKLLMSAGTAAQGAIAQADGKIVIVASIPVVDGNSFALTRLKPDGSLDPSFGTGGQTQGNLGGLRPEGEEVHSLTVQGDGKLVVAGIGTGLVNGTANSEFALARYDANGALDISFGAGGKVFFSFGNGRSSLLRGVAIQADGKLVAVGSTPGTRNDYNFALARFLGDGSVDTSFGTGGSVVTDFSQLENDNSAESVAIQANGKVVVAGWVQLGGSGSDIAPALTRYNANGSIDSSFGTGGQVSNTALIDNFGGPATVIVQADGKIVFAKNVDTSLVDFAISRFNADGSPDIGFGSNGVVKTDLGRNEQDRLLTMVQQADGKLLLAGATQVPKSSLFAVVRYQTSGSLDAGFGNGGIATTDFGLASAFCLALAIQPDGNIVAVGTASDGTPEIALARYTP